MLFVLFLVIAGNTRLMQSALFEWDNIFKIRSNKRDSRSSPIMTGKENNMFIIFDLDIVLVRHRRIVKLSEYCISKNTRN